MRRLHLHDTVALKRDSTFIGSVERTSQWEHEPLLDVLIIAHIEVPLDVYERFVSTGTPPPGFVFVEFAAQERGSSLVAEDDLVLLNRDLEVGDVVKQNPSQMTGSVINISSTYTIDPVWEPRLSVEFGAKPAYRCLLPDEADSLKPYILNPNIRHPQPERLIPDVPFEELKRAQDFIEGDYIVESEWLGLVDAVNLMVVVKLENNSVVVIQEPEDLSIPIPEFNKRFLHIPDFDGITRPLHVSTVPGWDQVVPPEDLECGQFVVTSHRNIKNGRWLRGSYDPKVKPQGHVLMVRCQQLRINWLVCNAYAPSHHSLMPKPGDSSPYENLNLFYAPQEIRKTKQVTLYDPSRPARRTEDRTREGLRQTQAPSERCAHAVTVSSSFSVGQRVKFRDAAGAAIKYQGQSVSGEVYARFARILPSDTQGFDLNEFEVIYSQQNVTVRWQDGSVTHHLSVELDKVNLFESDLAPADIVVARHELKMREQLAEDEDYAAPPNPLVDFNEMAFFEKPHELLATKVGIIQNVNPGERLAQIRWFKDPSVWITTYGNALGGSSRFGPISDTVEDVSLYEVMTFGGLMRKLREIVVIPPSYPCVKAIKLLSDIQPDDLYEVNASIIALSQLDARRSLDILEWMQHNASKTREIMPASRLTQESQYKSNRSVDWVGEICELRTDGRVVVRVGSGDQGLDVILEHDQVLAMVDDVYVGDFDYHNDPMDLDESSDSDFEHSSDESVLSETVEYEGGKRIDDDSGDDNWESEDEPEKAAVRASNAISTTGDVSSHHDDLNSDIVMDNKHSRSKDLTLGIHNASPNITKSEPEQKDRSEQSLVIYMPNAEPVPFLSLDRDPPTDQFRANIQPSTSATFLKRIAREHRILSTSLPRREIYVRTYDSRLDLLRCLIIGPLDTPYEHAPFFIDLHLGPNFPREPPTAHFHSWTSGLGRINPNLYEEGKICLSLLGTWPGKSETEGWTEKATILQLLVSLQGLVFVKAPFYNEAGFEGYEQTREYNNESLHYSEKAYVMGRNFVKHALTSPIAAMEDILAWTYLDPSQPPSRDDETSTRTSSSLSSQSQQKKGGLLSRLLLRSHALMDRSEDLRGPSTQLGGSDDEDRLLGGDGTSDDETKVFMRPLSKGAFVMLRRTIKILEEIRSREREDAIGNSLGGG